MVQENKINFKRPKKQKLQTIWNFIRRNPTFRVSEIQMVCDVSSSYLQKYLRTLVAARYIVFISKVKKPYSSREYRLIKNTGVKAPVYLRDGTGLWDENLKKRIPLKPKSGMKFLDLKRVLKLVQKEAMISFDEISSMTRVSKEDLSLDLFEKIGIIESKISGMDNTFIFDCERVDVVIETIDKKNLEKDEDVRFLWM